MSDVFFFFLLQVTGNYFSQSRDPMTVLTFVHYQQSLSTGELQRHFHSVAAQCAVSLFNFFSNLQRDIGHLLSIQFKSFNNLLTRRDRKWNCAFVHV